jgi:hypothetical protein
MKDWSSRYSTDIYINIRRPVLCSQRYTCMKLQTKLLVWAEQDIAWIKAGTTEAEDASLLWN